MYGACPSTGKVQYGNHKQAVLAAYGIRKDHGISMYAYRCPYCRTWHLATRRKNRRKARRKWRFRLPKNEALI